MNAEEDKVVAEVAARYGQTSADLVADLYADYGGWLRGKLVKVLTNCAGRPVWLRTANNREILGVIVGVALPHDAEPTLDNAQAVLNLGSTLTLVPVGEVTGWGMRTR